MLDRRTPSIEGRNDVFDNDFRIALEAAIRRQFEGHDIARVELCWKVDFDDEDFLSVDVIIGDDISGYSDSSLSGATRQLREVLMAFSVVAFPLVRFISTAEADEVSV